MIVKQFDDIFQYTGGIGVYQICLFLILGVVCFLNAFHLMGMTMLGASIDHWCKVNRLANFSHDQQKYISIPYGEQDNNDAVYSQCSMYNLTYDDFSDDDFWNWNRSHRVSDADVVECTDEGWVYDQSLFLDNVVTEFNLVCARAHLLPLTSAIYQIGILTGAVVSGYLSDRFGRKPVLNIGIFGFIITSFMVIFTPNYWSFTIVRFVLSLTQHIGFLCGFVIILEMTGAKDRTVLGCMYHMLFSIGSMTMAVTAYFIRDYSGLYICWAVPITVCVLHMVITPESPRWLIAKGKYKQAKDIITDMAEVNCKEIPVKLELEPQPEILEVPLHGDINTITNKEIDGKQNSQGNMSDIFKSGILRREIFIVYFVWFANNLLYYGLSLNAGSLPGSVFLNVFLMSGIEIPAVIICILGLFYVGRRPTLAYGLLIAGVANLVCVPFIIVANEDLDAVITIFSLIGKACIKLSFVTIYVFTGELFPTPVRHLAIGSASMISKIGGIIAPYMGESMISVWKPLPSVIFGSTALCAGVLSMWLPETLNVPLPDTIQDAEQLARRNKSPAASNLKEQELCNLSPPNIKRIYECTKM